jgi:signal transduction histidine kinase
VSTESGAFYYLRDNAFKDAGRCSTEARQSLWGLRAARGEALKFSEKLDKLARQAVAERPISLLLQLEPVSLDALPDVEYQVLRIAQEAISNAVRHAHARTIKIRLNVEEEELGLTFADDGTGFDAELDQTGLGHFGLLGMRERASEIGAELSVTSSPGHGTEVSIQLPFPSSQVSEGNQGRAFEH